MLPSPIEHHFDLNGESYLLVEWTRGGERRLRADFALASSASPGVIDSIDGGDLYAEAVARECLKEAPAIFWETRPPSAGANGTPQRVVNLDQVPRALWEAFRKEVDAFLALIFPPVSTELRQTSGERPAEPVAVAPAQAVPALFRGRAE